MNATNPYTLGFFVLLLLSGTACQPKKNALATTGKIAVLWELVTNFTGEKDAFYARFQLTNHSDVNLDDKNWALFFSMAPRPILDNQTEQPARLHHINGDWYVLKPDKNFHLPPGESIDIFYRGVEAVIKETDRPLGLYFVFYDDEGKEQKIENVIEYTWKPFVSPDQINRNEKDEEPIPTAALSYKNNLDMTDLSSAAVKPIIPSPVSLVMDKDSVEVNNAWAIYFEKGLEGEAAYLAAALKEATGLDLKTQSGAPQGKAIRLLQAPLVVNGVAHEAYALNIMANGIDISGSDAAGVFYGIQSLRACIPLKSYASRSGTLRLPKLQVNDAPRFAFRGLHLDVSRNFQTKETILRTLDLLSFYKINRFLFYTTEDEGWRLEIKDLPELTDVGAQRQHTSGKEAPALHPAYGSGPFAKEEGRFGHGYYSRTDFIEILKYATARHIKIIPEVNFPGHARAAIKAMEARYERLMKEGKEDEANEYRLIDPDDKSVYLSAQGYQDNVVCVARESVFHFYEKVVDEIATLYQEAGLTLDEFHTGGDEVPEGAWTKSPMAMALMREHPEIKDPKNLQTYFLRELVKRLKSRNLQLDGWEEVALAKKADGKYEPNPEFVNANVVPYIWNNIFDYPDLGYRLANAGYKVVLCNVSNFYFDLAYSKDPQEPGLYWAGFVDTRHSWTFAPYDMFKTTKKNSLGQKLDLETVKGYEKNKIIVEHLKPQARKNILGLEAQVWCETVKGRDMLEYYVLPKLVGFAESAWAAERSWETVDDKTQREKLIRDGWNVFANSLGKRELPRLHYLNGGYNYRVPPPGAVIENGELKANVEYPGLTIHYTTDGTEPTIASPRYEKPVAVKGPVVLRSFDDAGKGSHRVNVSSE
ncbi:family 20 glycosylhydrolase [Chryseolinea soli]|uniref:beta-N-acetylhexosaminidase n=1 Tax=Chryseolinea soli TaxID=2321403 RepID=A0A385SMH3_9BACT|nr:family 20 glycosylhydrolase [Chryseolinea soli]AYB31551.1 beta-N-acetylhexosaminidase [Chryseolinea soli]